MYVKPFSTNVPLLYPLKTLGNLVFGGYRSGTLVQSGLSSESTLFVVYAVYHLLFPVKKCSEKLYKFLKETGRPFIKVAGASNCFLEHK